MVTAAADAPPRTRRVSARARNDAVLLSAVDLARGAAEEVAGSTSDVGEHLGAVAEGERLMSHRFAAAMPGYHGWHWTVTLARVPRGRTATVCEVELLPGDEAILAPEWVPWSERLRPGDLGAGDTLPYRPDDPRLEAGWAELGDEELDSVARELALTRARVLSPAGRDAAAERWYRGSQGPTSPVAVASAAECMTCAFLVPLSGPLGQLFGVCANEWSPDDGKVVSLDHGCGAHSETDVDRPGSEWPADAPLIDDMVVEPVEVRAEPEPVPAAEPEPADQLEPTDDETT